MDFYGASTMSLMRYSIANNCQYLQNKNVLVVT